MTEFAIAIHGVDDWRLCKYDSKKETTVISEWSTKPNLGDCLTALMNHHSTGDQPFVSRKGALDCLQLSNQWPLPTRDMTLDDSNLPWND